MEIHLGYQGTAWPTIVQAISTFMIGIIAAGVAGYGVYVQRRKLDLDLFEHRFEFYTLFLRYKRASRSKSGVSPTLESAFQKALSRAKFLFPEKVSKIVLEVASLGDEYQDLAEQLNEPLSRKAALARRGEIRKRQDALITDFEKAVEKHLRFAR